MENEKHKYKYIFGPVPSRRLGFSLGIDLVPFKTCSYDCIYCQLGKTTHLTTAKKEYAPVKEIISELKRRLTGDIKVDYITLSGSGEPTLYSALGELIPAVKQLSGKPVAVLTNGSLLGEKEVSEGLKDADLVIPSLDAGNERVFRRVNRPCAGLEFARVVDGLIRFCTTYKHKTWLEVFLLKGITDGNAHAARINAIIQKINPGRIQLNTVKRPPAESAALPVSERRMRRLAAMFNGVVEVIADFSGTADRPYFRAAKADLMDLLRRRPCTLEDMCAALNLHRNEVCKYIDILSKDGALRSFEHDHTLFYTCA